MAQTAISIEKNGWSARLKWHQGRRIGTDIPFDPRRLREGLSLGASLEVDLQLHAEDGYVVLHDARLDTETTGSGPVALATRAVLRHLRLRDRSGAPTDLPVMLLEDLCALLADTDAARAPLVQLDYKIDALPTEAQLASFARAVAPVRGRVILSGGHAQAIETLAAAIPGLPTGYDPCLGPRAARLGETRDFDVFMREALAAAPAARIFYLEIGLLLAAADDGVDLVAICHADGREVDAWTVRRIDAKGIEKVHRLMDLKVDQITTDDPEALSAAFAP